MRVSADHQINRARERFALHDYYGAIHLLEEVASSGRVFADVLHLLGLSYSLVGQPEKALEFFDQALGLNPRYFEAHVHRGIVLNEMGRRGEADEAFRRAATSNPEAVDGLPWNVAAQLAGIHATLDRLLAGISAAQLNWQPDGGQRWSIGQCLDHLTKSADLYSKPIDDAIGAAPPATPRVARPNLPGRAFLWFIEPPVRLKTPAPGTAHPASTFDPMTVRLEFERTLAILPGLARRACDGRLRGSFPDLCADRSCAAGPGPPRSAELGCGHRFHFRRRHGLRSISRVRDP